MPLVSQINAHYTGPDNFLDDGADGLDITLTTAGWDRLTFGEELDAAVGQQDRVYYSVGTNGQRRLWIRVTHDGVTNRINFRMYSFWQRTVIAPPLAPAGYNEAGDQSGATSVQLAAGAINNCWIVADEDGIAVAASVGANYNKVYVGLLSPMIPPQKDFFGALAGPAAGTNQAGTSTLLFQAGTDFTNLQNNQFLWVVNQSSTSGPSNVEKVQVAAFNPVTLRITTVAPLVESYDINAVAAVDPQPLVAWGNTGGTLSGATAYALHNTDTYGGGLTHTLSSTSFVDAIGLTAIPSTDYSDVPLSDVVFYDGGVGHQNVLGALARFRRVPTGAVAEGDDITVGTDVSVIFADGAGFYALQET
jgi:hypothetical protein